MPNIYLDYSLKCINSKPTKGKAPQLEGTFVRREFSLKIELIVSYPQLFLKVPLLILLLVKVPFFNMMSLEMVLSFQERRQSYGCQRL